MPIYEYECQKCGEVFEVFQKMSDPAPKSHSCGSRKVRRLISQTSFQLKGSGWYVTDYASKEKKAETAKAKAREKGSDSSSSDTKTKSDSKSKPKAKAKTSSSDKEGSRPAA